VASGLAERLRLLADRVGAADAGAVTDDEVRRFLVGRNPRLRGALRDVLAVREMTEATRLRRRPGHPCVLREVGDRVVLLLGDRELTVPGWLRPALESVRAADELRPADLDLDPQSRLVLCRRLVREGLLEVVS